MKGRYMKKNIKKLVLLGAVIIGVCLRINGAPVFADNAKSTMTLSPLNQKIILIPGEEYRGAVRVSSPNDATQNLDYSVSIGSFSQKSTSDSVDDYGEVDSETRTSYNQIMDWITLDFDKGSVAPNSTDVVTFTINVPEDAAAGGQYATILVRNNTDYYGDISGSVSIKSMTGVASIIYAEVAGQTRNEGAIIENNIPSFLLNNSLETTAMVRNDGNVHTDAKYTLQVWPLFSNEEICTNEEDPEKSFVLPDTERYHLQTCDLPPFGIFRAKQVVKLFGKTSVLEKTIIVCPLWLLFVIIAVIIALVFWIVFRVKNNKRVNKSDSSEE